MSESSITTTCPVCVGNDQSIGPVYNGMQLLRCKTCDFVYTAVRAFSDDLYDQVYAKLGGYREMMDVADQVATGNSGFRQLWWFKRMALRWLEKATTGRRMIDIGCGPGTFLLVAKRRGWEVTGVEPAAEAAEKASGIGLDVFHGYVADFVATAPRPFDVAVSFEVLEHVPDPVAVMREIHRLLKPGGLVFISVPNQDDPYCLKVPNPLAMPPIHINFFNRKSLGKTLTSAGFEAIRFKSLPIPTSSVRNIYGMRDSYALSLLATGIGGRQGRWNNLDCSCPRPLS